MSRTLNPDRVLDEYRHQYPGALSDVARVRELARDRGVTWADWCWAPLGAFHSHVVQATRINPDAEAACGPDETAIVGALTTWMLGRGVYVPDAGVTQRAIERFQDAASGTCSGSELLSLERWAELPEFCCYVTAPDVAREFEGSPDGVFVHLDHDTVHDEAALRFVLVSFQDEEPDCLTPVSVELSQPIGEAVRTVGMAALASAATLVDPHARAVDETSSHDRPSRAQALHNGTWSPATRTRLWHVVDGAYSASTITEAV